MVRITEGTIKEDTGETDMVGMAGMIIMAIMEMADTVHREVMVREVLVEKAMIREKVRHHRQRARNYSLLVISVVAGN